MDEIRVDIQEMVRRLRLPNRDEVDIFAIPDAIDFLEYIDDSYANEKPFLVAQLKESDDDETISFIICVLRIINNTLDEEIIEILGKKIDIIIKQNQFYYSKWYILKYFSIQGAKFKAIIIPILLKVISSDFISSSQYSAFRILWKWLGFWKAVSAVRKGSYIVPEETLKK